MALSTQLLSLLEIFRSDDDIQNLTSISNAKVLYVNIDGNRYRFSATPIYGGMEVTISFGLWNVKDSAYQVEYQEVGHKTAMKVFTLAARFIRKVLEIFPHAQVISFFADKEKPSRVKLYTRLAKLLAQKTNGKVQVQKTGSGFYYRIHLGR